MSVIKPLGLPPKEATCSAKSKAICLAPNAPLIPASSCSVS